MQIREATTEDKTLWNTFADTEGGNFYHYFDWKYFYEACGSRFIPLVIENDASLLIGILPIIKESRFLYAILSSDILAGGLLLKTDLPAEERNEAIAAVLKYVDANYSAGCSRFTLRESLSMVNTRNETPTEAFIDSGYRFRYNAMTQLPCTFVLELDQPFEEKIWKGLWSHHLRHKVSHVEREGIIVVRDRDLHYVDDFVKMLNANYKRHGTAPVTKQQIMAILEKFSDRTGLYIALQEGQPIMAQICFYNSSVCLLSQAGSYAKNTGNANVLCVERVIKDACDAGYKYVELGFTGTPGLAFFKSQFRGTRVPVRIYEKRYSKIFAMMELGGLLLRRIRVDKAYLWKNRRKLWDMITRW